MPASAFLQFHEAAFRALASPLSSRAARSSRKDQHLQAALLPFFDLRRAFIGAICLPSLPPFSSAMSVRRTRQAVPGTPRVISPSPTPSERDAAAAALGGSQDSYFGPVTRSAARKRPSTPQRVEEELDEDSSDSHELRRARTRSRSPIQTRKPTKLTAVKPAKAPDADKANGEPAPNGKHVAPVENGHLSPPSPAVYTGWTWRDFSRSPSPLGLIPIHRHWRTFVHKHEVPRKALHVSIGFLVIWLYLSGSQTYFITPWLLGALIPIASVDVLRHHYAPFNRFYVRVLGALMRESEYAGYNGVIFYLVGAWAVLYFFPKDIGVMGTLLLSWCDTAASTFGRLYGRYTPRIRRGKSLAGSLAAFLVGVGTAAWFWGWLVPTYGPMPGDETFMFTGSLRLPSTLTDAVGLTQAQATVSGGLALGIVSIWSGLVASLSEVVDLFGWDDNLTIPVLSGLGIWGFLKVFG